MDTDKMKMEMEQLMERVKRMKDMAMEKSEEGMENMKMELDRVEETLKKWQDDMGM